MPLEDEFSDIIKKARTGQGLSVGDMTRMTGLSSGDITDRKSLACSRLLDNVAELVFERHWYAFSYQQSAINSEFGLC